MPSCEKCQKAEADWTRDGKPFCKDCAREEKDFCVGWIPIISFKVAERKEERCPHKKGKGRCCLQWNHNGPHVIGKGAYERKIEHFEDHPFVTWVDFMEEERLCIGEKMIARVFREKRKWLYFFFPDSSGGSVTSKVEAQSKVEKLLHEWLIQTGLWFKQEEDSE